MFAQPQAWIGSQLKNNLKEMPQSDGNRNKWFDCDGCSEACNPPHVSGRELEPPDDPAMNCTQQPGSFPQKICVEAYGS
jgi:hypothetical protein